VDICEQAIRSRFATFVRKLMRFSCVDMTENVAYICVDEDGGPSQIFTPLDHKGSSCKAARVPPFLVSAFAFYRLGKPIQFQSRTLTQKPAATDS